jgi:hypothetical protein
MTTTNNHSHPQNTKNERSYGSKTPPNHIAWSSLAALERTQLIENTRLLFPLGVLSFLLLGLLLAVLAFGPGRSAIAHFIPASSECRHTILYARNDLLCANVRTALDLVCLFPPLVHVEFEVCVGNGDVEVEVEAAGWRVSWSANALR